MQVVEAGFSCRAAEISRVMEFDTRCAAVIYDIEICRLQSLNGVACLVCDGDEEGRIQDLSGGGAGFVLNGLYYESGHGLEHRLVTSTVPVGTYQNQIAGESESQRLLSVCLVRVRQCQRE